MSKIIVLASLIVSIVACGIVYVLSWGTATAAQLAMTAVLSYLITCNTSMHVRI